MNNIEGSQSGRLTAHAQQVAPRLPLKNTPVNFPSYLRVFHVFPQHFSGELRWGSAPSGADFFERLPPAPASVAFV
jgi:hypothetical protein